MLTYGFDGQRLRSSLVREASAQQIAGDVADKAYIAPLAPLHLSCRAFCTE